MALVTLTVDASQAGLRADKLVALQYPEVSRTKLQKLFDNESVILDDEPINKGYVVSEAEVLTFPHPDTLFKPLEARKIDFNVLYEDKAFLAINKPVGMAVHPVSMDDTQTTIAHGVLAYLGSSAAKIGPVDRPCIVHRLDKETSGVLLIAKTQKAFDALKKLFADRAIHKDYLAIVRGLPDLLAGSITAPMCRSPRSPLKMAIAEEGCGKPSRTDWDLVAKDEKQKVALLRCRLHSGRTHQARVHLASIGYPVLGDETYGYRGTYTGRILLHAHTVELPHPITGKPMTLTAPIPADFLAFGVLFGVKK